MLFIYDGCNVTLNKPVLYTDYKFGSFEFHYMKTEYGSKWK